MISVVMAIYNGRKFIEKQLESICNQTMLVDEIIIVDDYSSQICDDIIDDFTKRYNISFVYKKHIKNVGYAQTFFEAINYSSGDYIFLSDQDDIWNLNKVEIMVGILKNNSNISCLSARNIIMDGEENYIKCEKKLHCYLQQVDLNSLIKKSLLRPGMSLVVTRKLVDSLKTIDTSHFMMHDRFIELIACINNEFFICNEYLTKYRIHGNNTAGMNLSRMSLRTDRKGRILQIQKEKKYLFDVINTGIVNDRLKDIIQKHDKYYSVRMQLLEKGVIRYIFGSLPYLYGYRELKFWLGDCLSLFQDGRFF